MSNFLKNPSQGHHFVESSRAGIPRGNKFDDESGAATSWENENPKDAKRYVTTVSPSPSSLLGRPLSPKGFFGQGGFLEVGMASVVEGRSVEEEDPSLDMFERNNVSNSNAFDPNAEMGLEEVPISLAGRADDEEDQEVGSWEDSCLQIFSNFLGFWVKGHEEEIFNLMNSTCERRNNQKGKGTRVSTKFDRELKKLQWNVKEKSNRGESSKGGKGLYVGW